MSPNQSYELANEFSSRAWCLLIGLDQYSDDRFENLTAPTTDVQELNKILVDNSITNVPEEHIICLVNDSATLEGIEESFKTLRDYMSKEDTLFIYFGGHGTSEGLCVYDTNFEQSDTILDGDFLSKALYRLKARGIFMVLDCCKGAGLTNNLPNFFRIADNTDYKILLSSSGANEPSWELPDGKGTLFSRHLIKTLAGIERAGVQSGLVYFSDLLSHIQLRLQEDQERFFPGRDLQSPVFVGTYRKDPLLFIQRFLLPKNKAFSTAQISRAHLKRKIIRSAFTVLTFAIIFMGIYYSILDKSEFVKIDDGVIAVFKGRPNHTVFGFPQLKWQYEFTADAIIDENNSIRKGGEFAAPIGEKAVDLLLPLLRPKERATLLIQSNKTEEAIVFLRNQLNSQFLSVDQISGCLNLLALFAEHKDLALLRKFSTHSNTEIRFLSAWIIFNLDPLEALKILFADKPLDLELHRYTLANIFETDPNVRKYLDQLIHNNESDRLFVYTIAAAQRIGYDFDPDVLTSFILRLIKKGYVQQDLTTFGTYAQSRKELGKKVYTKLMEFLDTNIDKSAIVFGLLRFIAEIPTQGSNPLFDKLIIAKEEGLKYATNLCIAVHHDAPLIKLGVEWWKKHPEIVTALALRDFLSGDELVEIARDSNDPRILPMYHILMGIKGLQSTVPYLRSATRAKFTTAADIDIEQARLTAIIALEFLKAPPKGTVEKLLSAPIPMEGYPHAHNVRQEALIWLSDYNRDRVFKNLKPKLADPRFEFAVHVLGRMDLTENHLSYIRSRIKLRSHEGARAAAILSMHGTLEDLQNLQQSHYLTNRSQYFNYVIVNPLLEKHIQKTSNAPIMLSFRKAFQQMILEQKIILDAFKQVPKSEIQQRWWMMSASRGLSPGAIILINKAGQEASFIQN